MKANLWNCSGSWRDVADSSRVTVGMEPGDKEPTSRWKKNMLLAEHSPIRKITIDWIWYDLKSWVSVHFVRHHIGIEHWVKTQRSDRTGIDRDKLPQDNFVTHECQANAQSMINISRKRLCSNASPETREAWKAVLEEIKHQIPELYDVCVPECIYRGFCPEMKTCGYYKTSEYKRRLEHYRDIGRE